MAPDIGWPEVSLGEIAHIKHGWPFKSDFFSAELTGRPIVVNIGNFRYTGGFRFDSTTVREYRDDYPAEYELSPGDILLAMTCQTAGGEILGIPARVPADGRIYLHNQRLGKVVIHDDSKVVPEYLYWLFHWPAFNRHLFLSASGTKILHTSPGRIESFQFRLPSVTEQRAIANTLGALHDKIDLNRRMNATLEAMARALFQAWFVDFEPVRAKAEGAKSFAFMPESVFNRLSIDLVESSRGLIPTGWRISTIGEEVRVVGGGTPSTTQPEYWDNGVHAWATPRDLSKLESCLLIDTERRVTDVGLERISSGLLPTRTVLLSSRAPIGYLALAEIPTAVNQGFIAMVCDKWLPPEYVLNWCALNMEEIKGRANGTTFLEVSKANFRPITLIVPDATPLQAFVDVVRPMYDRIAANLRENSTLGETRDRLLPKLMSGEVRVRP